MTPSEVAPERKHLRRSEAIFIVAAVAFVFGVLTVYLTPGLFGSGAGSPSLQPESWVIWLFSLFGFVAVLWGMAVVSRSARRGGG